MLKRDFQSCLILNWKLTPCIKFDETWTCILSNKTTGSKSWTYFHISSRMWCKDCVCYRQCDLIGWRAENIPLCHLSFQVSFGHILSFIHLTPSVYYYCCTCRKWYDQMNLSSDSCFLNHMKCFRMWVKKWVKTLELFRQHFMRPGCTRRLKAQ